MTIKTKRTCWAVAAFCFAQLSHHTPLVPGALCFACRRGVSTWPGDDAFFLFNAPLNLHAATTTTTAMT